MIGASQRPLPWPETPPGTPVVTDRCPHCGQGRLRFDREIPAMDAVRRYHRCTAPDCGFECLMPTEGAAATG